MVEEGCDCVVPNAAGFGERVFAFGDISEGFYGAFYGVGDVAENIKIRRRCGHRYIHAISAIAAIETTAIMAQAVLLSILVLLAGAGDTPTQNQRGAGAFVFGGFDAGVMAR